MSLQKIILAKPRGFCAGVERAIEVVEQALKRFEGPVYVRKEIVHNLKLFLENLNDEPKNSSNSIQITIGAIHGNLSFENIIQTVQQTNIKNKTEVINHIQEFRNELQKTNPDKSKLKRIIEKLEDVGVGVVSGLLVEAGKRFLGL